MNKVEKSHNINYKGFLRIDILLLCLYFILAPFEQTLNFGYGTILKYVATLFVIFSLLRIFKGLQRINLSDPIIYSLLLLIIISNLSYFWSVDIETTAQINTTYLYLQILFVSVYIRNYTNREQEFVKKSILLGGSAVIIYMYVLSPNLFNEYRVTFKNTDSNEFAAILILPLFIAFGEFIEKKKSVYLAFFLIILFSILITGSRGAMLATFFALIYYSLNNLKLNKIVYLLLTVIIFYFAVLPFIPDFISQRLWGKGALTNDFGARDTRIDIWSTLLTDIFPENPLFGSGSASGGHLLSRYFGQDRGVHNTYFSMIIDYGILGLPVFLYLLYKLFNLLKREKDYAKICSFLAIIVIIFFLDAYFKKFFWNVLMYSVITVKGRIPIPRRRIKNST